MLKPPAQPNPIYLLPLASLPNLILTTLTLHFPLTPLIQPIPLERYQLLPNTYYCHREQILLKVALSQKVQDSFFIANFAIFIIPFYYPKQLHPLHSIDKMSIFKTFTFTCVVYLQVQEVGFMSSTNNFIS